MNYTKIVKYVSWALLILGILCEVIGLAVGFDNNPGLVDLFLYFGYAMVAVSIAAILVLGILTSDKKSLIKAAIYVVLAVVVVGITYAIAPGNELVSSNAAPQTHGTLKMVDMVLYLTYLLFACSILSIVAVAIVNKIRK